MVSDQANVLKSSLDWRLYPWLWARLRETEGAAAERNARLEFRLGEYSRRVLAEVAEREAIDYDRNPFGILYIFRHVRELDGAIAQLRALGAGGEACLPLDRAGVAAVEPALRGVDGLAGAILRVDDETGDPAKFTRALADRVVARGGLVRTGVTVGAVEVEGDEVTSVHTDHGPLGGDAFVLALGSANARLARSIGIKLPIYPLKGYSLTAPIAGTAHAPLHSIVDGENGVAISRIGDRLRVAGAVEFAGYDTSHRPADFAFMKAVAADLFPRVADYEHSDKWAGLGPATPNGLPILGARRYRNLFVNAGHGHNGWATSHGSAKITADLIAGRPPAIPLEGMNA